MNGTLPIPDRPEAITSEWLNEALASSVPGAEVARVEVLDQHSGTTGRMRIGLEYAAGPVGPDSLFVKLAPFDAAQRELVAMTDMGRREARFYATLAEEVPLRVPRPYFAAYGDDPNEYVMLTEDLEASGATFTSRVDPHAEENAEQLISSLARLHAHFWDTPRFDDDLSWVPGALRGAYAATLVDQARTKFAADFPPVYSELASLFIENHARIRELWDLGTKTLIHGDTHAGNGFRIGETVGLYDWAVASRSPGIRDIAIYLGNSCPTEVRQREQERWLRTYHQILVDEGVNPPSYDELWTALRMTVLYSFVSSTTTAAMGSKWQPIEVGILGMTRSTATCDDLATVEAIREAL